MAVPEPVRRSSRRPPSVTQGRQSNTQGRPQGSTQGQPQQEVQKARGSSREPGAVERYLKEDRLLIEQELMQLPLFQSCCQEFVSQLSGLLGWRSLHVGHSVVQRGASLAVILRGSVQMLVDELPVARLTNGHWFGETVLLGIEDTWGATLRAETPCTIVDLARADFLEALRGFSTEARAFDAITARHRASECKSAGTLTARAKLLHGLSERAVQSLDKVLVRRVVFPKEKLLEEGAVGDELYILVQGKVVVEIAGRAIRHDRRDTEELGLQGETRRLAPQPPLSSEPEVYGELGLLGMTTARTATVSADTVCQVRVLYRPVFLRTLERHRESIQGFHSKPGAEPEFKDMGVFRLSGCGAVLLDFLMQHLEGRIYLPGQRIVSEAQAEDECVYLLSQGSAEVLQGEQHVGQLHTGAVFGHMPMFGLYGKRSTIVAEFVCHVRVLHRGVVLRGLELFPEERQKIMTAAFQSEVQHLEKDNAVFRQQADVRSAFVKVLKSSPLFAKTNPSFVDELSAVAVDRIYMVGDLIVEEGQRGDSMFIMVSGQAGVYVSNPEAAPTAGDAGTPLKPAVAAVHLSNMVHVGALGPGGISGELTMLGVSPTRSATIKADQLCCMWEITQEKALVILDRFPDAQRHFAELVVQHLDRTAPARVSSLPLFQAFDAKLRVMLGLHCERRAFFPGRVIAGEGQPGCALHIINVGVATLRKKGVVIKTYTSGSHYGSTVMLGLHKTYCGTLMVVQTCHVLSIPRASWLAALESFPSPTACQELRRAESAATEEMRLAMQRISARKLIWKRYQNLISESTEQATLKNDGAEERTSSELLASMLQSWHSWAGKRGVRRERGKRERAHYDRIMEQWLKRKREEQAMVQRRKELEQRRQRSLEMRVHPRWPPPPPEAEDEPQLPQVPPQLPATAQEAAMAGLAVTLADWPTPRLSPHYNLKVWDVLAAVEADTRVPRGPRVSRSADSQVGSGRRRSSFRREAPARLLQTR